jgi:single-strand DNA-binding protein
MQIDIAISRRFKDAVTGEWKDSDPTYVPIIVWGDQADRCADKLKKGSLYTLKEDFRQAAGKQPTEQKNQGLKSSLQETQFLVRIEQQQTSRAAVNNEVENEYVSDNDTVTDDEESSVLKIWRNK